MDFDAFIKHLDYKLPNEAAVNVEEDGEVGGHVRVALILRRVQDL